MNPHSLPPLLRGIGTTVVLLATILSVMFARADLRKKQTNAVSTNSPGATESGGDLSAVVAEVRGLKEEMDRESVAEEVLENRWFEIFGFLGTGIVASSFYAEWYVRRKQTG